MLSVTAGAVPPAVPGPWVASDPVNPSWAVLVRFLPGTSAVRQSADLAAVGGRVVTAYPDGPEVVALPPWADRVAALARLRSDGDLAYAEADAPFHAQGVPAVVPNDPYLAQQAADLNLIDAPQAWSITTGTPSTIVAVLDTGVDLTNPEFAGRLWVDPGARYRGHAVYGWNFVANNGNTQDNNGHGTHVTGILAAAGNNGYGIAGVDWGATIMPLKFLDAQGNGTTDAAVAAIYFAVQHGAKVINASWGGDVFSQAMLDALNYANAAGVVFVTAAGNDSVNNDAAPSYPASYRTPNELVVAAVNPDGSLASYSNYGPTTVDLAAPGTNVFSTVPAVFAQVTGHYAYYSGTSMATPYVSGTVALVAGLHPGLSAAQLAAMVRATARPLPSLKGLTISGGVVDPLDALTDTVTGGQVSAASSPVLVPGGSTPEAVEATILASDAYYAYAGGTPQGYVAALYNSLFGRPVEPSALADLTAELVSGTPRMTVVRALQTSTEALLTRAARWFRDDLGQTGPSLDVRKANPAVTTWAGLLAAGQSDTDVLADVLGSDAYYISAGGTPQGYVSALYNALFGRPVDPSGLAYFTAALAAGVSRPDLVRLLISTDEGHRTTIARLFINDINPNLRLSALKSSPGVILWAGYLGV
jgi:subtilisin family serine protease